MCSTIFYERHLLGRKKAMLTFLPTCWDMKFYDSFLWGSLFFFIFSFSPALKVSPNMVTVNHSNWVNSRPCRFGRSSVPCSSSESLQCPLNHSGLQFHLFFYDLDLPCPRKPGLCWALWDSVNVLQLCLIVLATDPSSGCVFLLFHCKSHSAGSLLPSSVSFVCHLHLSLGPVLLNTSWWTEDNSLGMTDL